MNAPVETPATSAPHQVTAVLGRGVMPMTGVAAEPVVTADDTGLTRGDGCFDATRVVTEADGRSRIDHLDAHLARFARSAAALELPDLDLAAWSSLVHSAVEAWDRPGEAVLKVMVSRGAETVRGPVTGVLTLTTIGASTLKQRRGLRVAALGRGTASDAYADAPWLLGGVKTLSYAVNQAAKREAGRRGADDVLFFSTDGYALEGPTSALIALIGDTLVTTPDGPTGILKSVTQTVIFEAASADGRATREQLMTLDEVAGARAAWLVSSVRGVAPITHLDGREMGRDAELDRVLTRYTGDPEPGRD